MTFYVIIDTSNNTFFHRWYGSSVVKPEFRETQPALYHTSKEAHEALRKITYTNARFQQMSTTLKVSKLTVS